MDLDKLFAELHEKLATDLLERIKDGKATASDLSVARQFLKDNNVSGVPAENTPIRNLAEELPDFEEDFDDDEGLDEPNILPFQR
jgi:hypothetical protein